MILTFALPLAQLISLQPCVLGLSSLTNLHSHPVKTTETLKGFPMPHWDFRNLLPPSKSWCHSYSMVPTPRWCRGILWVLCRHCRGPGRAAELLLTLHSSNFKGDFIHRPSHRGGLSQGTLGGSPPWCFHTSSFLSNRDPFSLQLGGSVLTLRSRHIVLCPFLAPFKNTPSFSCICTLLNTKHLLLCSLSHSDNTSQPLTGKSHGLGGGEGTAFAVRNCYYSTCK